MVPITVKPVGKPKHSIPYIQDMTRTCYSTFTRGFVYYPMGSAHTLLGLVASNTKMVPNYIQDKCSSVLQILEIQVYGRFRLFRGKYRISFAPSLFLVPMCLAQIECILVKDVHPPNNFIQNLIYCCDSHYFFCIFVSPNLCKTAAAVSVASDTFNNIEKLPQLIIEVSLTCMVIL